jgi:hypothetical protein
VRKFKCRCVKEIDNFNFEVGKVYIGIISAYETGITILGSTRDQETYFTQSFFEEYFEIV